jgi:hypothetical protein
MGRGNKLIVSGSGFPATNKTWRFISDAYSEPLSALATLAGEKTIISGVVTNVNNFVSNGYIVYQGEIIPFVGGNSNNNVSIIEEIENVNYNTDSNNNSVLDSQPAYRTKYATLGQIGSIVFAFSSLKRLKKLVDLTDFELPVNLVLDNHYPPYNVNNMSFEMRLLQVERKLEVFQPNGGMILWNKPANAIPAGWQEVVDWRGRIPAGMDISHDVDPDTGVAYSLNSEFAPLNNEFDITGTPGRTGGDKNRSLVTANLPPIPIHLRGSNDDYDSTGGPLVNTDNKEENGGLTITVGGTSTAFSILNPYRTVLFIEWIGI